MTSDLLYGSSAAELRSLFQRDGESRTLSEEWTRLPPIWAGGKVDQPKMCLVFINPTYRNQSTRPGWQGDRAPFIGLARIWKFLVGCGLLDSPTVDALPPDGSWSELDATELYRRVADRGIYVTNLVKACRTDSELPSLSFARSYADLLALELKIVRPDVIVPMGGLVASLILGKPFKLSVAADYIDNQRVPLVAGRVDGSSVVPSYFPVGRGNPKKAREILSRIRMLELGPGPRQM